MVVNECESNLVKGGITKMNAVRKLKLRRRQGKRPGVVCARKAINMVDFMRS